MTDWNAGDLMALWNWLLPFRAVAETEHLPSAAKLLNVTPAALSRSIRLLEDELNVSLFDRVGRNIRLNDGGRHLLSGVREGMRRISDAMLDIRGERYAGSVRISAPGPLSKVFVLPVLEKLGSEHPDLVVEARSEAVEDVVEMLLQGRLDLALVRTRLGHEEIEVEHVATLPGGIYCGDTHPLALEQYVSVEGAARHPFVAPLAGRLGVIGDLWPADVPRRVGLRVSHMQTAIDACHQGRFLVVLPTPVGDASGLRRLPCELSDSSELYLAQRKKLDAHTRIDLVAELVREQARGWSTPGTPASPSGQ